MQEQQIKIADLQGQFDQATALIKQLQVQTLPFLIVP
jgi:hypothetical protein